jgi:hypothetical protein
MLLLVLFGRGDCDTANTKVVDMIELSHIGNPKMGVTCHQVILWKIDPADGKYHVFGWRTLDPWNEDSNSVYLSGSMWCVMGKDETAMVRYTAKNFRESWSEIDPEREDRIKHWRGEPPNLFRKHKRPVVTEAERLELDGR